MKEAGIKSEDIPKEPQQDQNTVQILQKVSEVTADRSKEFIIPIKPKNTYHKILQYFNFEKKAHVYTLRLARVNTVMVVSGLSQPIPDSLELSGVLQFALTNAYLYGENLIQACAWAIHNDRGEPSKELIDIVRYDFTFETIQTILEWSVPQVAPAFLNSIVSIKGTTDVLKPKASPQG